MTKKKDKSNSALMSALMGLMVGETILGALSTLPPTPGKDFKKKTKPDIKYFDRDKTTRNNTHDLIGAKITKISFSMKPEIADASNQWETEKTRTMYGFDTGNVYIELDNGLVLNIGNSEWGGMFISSKEHAEKEHNPYEDIWLERKHPVKKNRSKPL